MANGPDKLDMIYDMVKETRDDVKKNTTDIASMDKKLAVHKTKSGILGTAGGAGVLGIKELFEALKAYFSGGGA